MRKTNLTAIAGVISKIYHLITIIALCIFTLSSCSKEETKQTTPDGSTKISITVGSITDEDLVSSSGAKMRSIAPKTATGEQILHKETVKFNDIEVDFTSAEGKDLSFGEHTKAIRFDKVKAALPSKQMSTRSLNPLAADIPMEVGVKYWFVLFNTTTQKFEQSLQLVSGTPTKLDVVLNQNYEWYAYSYDDTNDITALDPNNPQIQTKSDRPFLYTAGTIKATTTGDTPLSITFKHQLQQLKIRVDTRGLFGNVTTLLAKFASNTPLKTGTFNIKTGAFTGALTNVPIEDLTFSNVEADSERQVEARYYTADLTQRKYIIDLEQLSVKPLNNIVEDLPVSNIGLANRTFEFTTGGAGRIQYAKVAIYKVYPRKKILHVEGNAVYGYAASAKASGNFLRDSLNFGPDSEYLRIEGFDYETISPSINNLKNRLADPTNYPDIIIASLFATLYADDYAALHNYIKRGGVAFLMIENYHSAIPQTFLRALFNDNNITTIENGLGGAIYKFNDVESDILAWPFDDVRGKYWGQDGSQTLYVQNLPTDQVIIYTGSSVNYYPFTAGNAVSMFRHKTLNFFYIGDTGFLSNELQNGIYINYTIEPFATNSQNFPIAKPKYGHYSVTGALEPGKLNEGWQVHNAALFGNAFAVMIAQSHYTPVDRSPF
ncbi:hypothetical protein [Sphingobacterium faecale]|uniref:Uncharacterized protein n=1 Tax=Sphingobacterium faecale TaxID=2803775 RepID=A0ABS1QYN8_9SPHI|nr:hypothetical protein [Sphingobacterium faecale]MBL1407543.1 hypothetical protein [Sphingobacterium faecale]